MNTLVKFSAAAMAAALIIGSSCNHKAEKAQTLPDTVAATTTDTTASPTAAATVEITDFYATWCGPCKQQAPILDAMVKKYGDRVKLVRVDIDQEPQKAGEYGVTAVPTLVFESSNGKKENTVGLQSQEDLELIINELMR